MSRDDAPSSLERIVSPTPSAKKRLSALQRVKKLGGKLKPKSKKTAELIVEEPEPEPEPEPEIVIEQVEIPDPPEPATLAQRIRALITSLPTPSPTPPPVRSDPPAVDADGRPIPPPGAFRIKDERLIALLSDPDFMNGAAENSHGSVWEALDSLAPPASRKPTSGDDSPDSPDHHSDGDTVQTLSDVMLYCPLFPTDNSELELAHTKIINLPVSASSQSRWNFLWSITVGLVKSVPQETKQVKVWVPSATKISFQAMWWGYRLYLPPPVMAHLNAQQAEAVKIAGTITAALTWLLAHVDPSQVPPALLPVFLLVQKLGPYVGYIGTFIGWIWGTIQGKDKGNGVCLTATWLAPVVLIPSSIEASAPEEPTPPQPPATDPQTPATDPLPPTTTPSPTGI
ncbi:hypothetical protein MIND_01054800 [Mycena indigotica]|uniref:Uncharacterized protein n=1 Tax=Mycena indigotica TaxID=2126181 RepID=A0A8H6S904_9AGAR|nr:uncharacterized protein MIND_01054800 [Mycena indigotica]KAF7295161.1 hypothetical protein MIND_01054800 [Mycena indigotica]